jgi:hypothetical protein
LEKTREEREQRNPPSKEATRDQGEEASAHLEGASVSLITVPVKEVDKH